MCTEMHDHHCPWVGTCIGHRNIRLFIGFLVFTSLHGIITVLISTYVNSLTKHKLINKHGEVDFNMNSFIITYSLIFTIILSVFSLYQMFGLVMFNITTNEDLRMRWNGNPRNWDSVKIY